MQDAGRIARLMLGVALGISGVQRGLHARINVHRRRECPEIGRPRRPFPASHCPRCARQAPIQALFCPK